MLIVLSACITDLEVAVSYAHMGQIREVSDFHPQVTYENSKKDLFLESNKLVDGSLITTVNQSPVSPDVPPSALQFAQNVS